MPDSKLKDTPAAEVRNMLACRSKRRGHRWGRPRAGATVLEVMFSIFVAVVGLMGIASLIPLAARNAEQSNASNNAVTQGKIWLNDFVARGFNDHDGMSVKGVGFNWLWRNDSVNPNTLLAYSKLGPNGGLPTATGSDAGHTSQSVLRTWQQQSVCIDPVFMADSDVVLGFNSNNSRIGAYRSAVFPYYEDGYNPIEDSAANAGTNPWQDQPRMLRLSLGGGAGQIPAKMASDLFVSKDDLATIIDDSDNTIPASRIFAAGGTKSLTSGDYSWMATLSPEPSNFPTQVTNDYVLSLVVMQRRDKQFIDLEPTGAGVVSTNPPVASDEESKPAGERYTWVVPLSGNFTGGTGGRIRLISNAYGDDELHVGDWIMLGKWYGINPTNALQRFSIFRWYRIIAMDEKPQTDFLSNVSPSGADPYGNSAGLEVWSRDVVVEGPDWDFTAGQTVGGNVVPTPTTGTVMGNVVTVIERRITVD